MSKDVQKSAASEFAGEKFVCINPPSEWFLIAGEPTENDAMEASRLSPDDFAPKARKIVWDSAELFDFAKATGTEYHFRRPAILLTSFDAPGNGVLLASAGADYFFEIFCNGIATGGTLKHGNGGTPVSGSDHILKIPVKKGKNTLAFYVQSGSKSWKGAMIFLKPDRKKVRRLSTEAVKFKSLPPGNELRYGPWITHVRHDAALIHFTTPGQIAVAVDFRASGESEWQRRFSLSNRYLRRDCDRHRLELTGLMAETIYEFRIVLFPKDDTKNGGFPPFPEAGEVLPEIHSFRTLAAPGGKSRFFVMSDTHLPNASRLMMLKKYEEKYHFTDADFFVHLGDIASSADNFDDEILGGFAEFFTRPEKNNSALRCPRQS